MATWKKILTRDSAVSTTDGLILEVTADSIDGATITLSDGTNTDDIAIVAGTGIDFTSTGAGGFTIDIDSAEIQDALDDVTLESSQTNTSNVTLTLTGPGSEEDSVEIVAGTGITLTNNNAGQFTITNSAPDTTLTEEEVEDIVGGMLGGTETGIDVTYVDGAGSGDGTINFIVDDQTLTTAQVSNDITITMSNPTTDDSITVTAGDNITLTDDSNGGFTIAASATASNVTVTDSDTDELAHLVFTTSTSGSAALKVDSSTLSYNASSDTLFVNNLTVSGTSTTVQTATLVVEDKNIVLGNPDSAYATDAAAVAGASGGGITLVSDSSGAEGDYAGLSWDNGTQLTQWQLRDASSTGESGTAKFPIAIMEFDANTGAPGSGDNAAGVGSFHYNTADSKLYIRTA